MLRIPSAYVMINHPNDGVCRVGRHNQTDALRERQVSNGKGEPWKIVDSLRCSSKLEAAAVEAFAHALLEKHVGPHKAASGQGGKCSTARRKSQSKRCMQPTKRCGLSWARRDKVSYRDTSPKKHAP